MTLIPDVTEQGIHHQLSLSVSVAVDEESVEAEGSDESKKESEG